MMVEISAVSWFLYQKRVALAVYNSIRDMPYNTTLSGRNFVILASRFTDAL